MSEPNTITSPAETGKKKKAAKKAPKAIEPKTKKVATYRLAANVDAEKIRSKQARKIVEAMKEKLGEGTFTAEEISKVVGSSLTKQSNKVGVVNYFLNKHTGDVDEKLFVAGADREVEYTPKKRAKAKAA